MTLRGVPPPVANTLRALTIALARLLGSNLHGIYVYGSLTQAAFDRVRSDLDCLVVVRRHLTDAQLQRLRAWLAQAAIADPWMHRVQMQVLLRRRLLRSDARGALYQFGILTRSGSDGNPIAWMNVLATGITLIGPSPQTFLPRITEEMVFAALVREVGYLRAEIVDPASEWRGQRFYRAYAVLTLCRILCTHRTGEVASKPRAARWALRTLPERWHSLVQAAIGARPGALRPLPLPRIARFIEFVAAQVAQPTTHTPKRRPNSRAGSSYPA